MPPSAAIAAVVALVISTPVSAVPSIVEPVGTGVLVVRDDQDCWGGMVMGITHMNAPPYQARKVLDLSGVSEATWAAVRAVRLSAYFMVRDYSWHDMPAADGLDEAYEVIVNGVVHRYATSAGAPVFREGEAPAIAWHDLEIPKGEVVRGPNEVLIHKAEGGGDDDYLYLGIDNSIGRGNSAVTFDGSNWGAERLNVPGGAGEYMVRLYLICEDLARTAVWRPGADPAIEDKAGLIVYAGAHGAQYGPAGATIDANHPARMEWEPEALDRLRPVVVTVPADEQVSVAWLDAAGKPMTGGTSVAGRLELSGGRSFDVAGVLISPAGAQATVSKVSFEGTAECRPAARPIDLCPPISPAAGREVRGMRPTCRIEGGTATLENAVLACRFRTQGHIRLASLYNRITATEMVRAPRELRLFLLEVDGVRYSGSRDFVCESVRPAGDGFEALLSRDAPALQARLGATIDDEGLRLALTVVNSGTTPLDFKLSFPHLAGLAASDDPAADYYFFPKGGGIIADRPAMIRGGYGDHEALYQVMDLFSPSRGGGLSVRTDDAEGWHKVLSLRKHIAGAAEVADANLGVRAREEYQWQTPLDAVQGTSLSYDYLRRTRAPGDAFTPAPAVIAAHAGDWRVPFAAYADWAHRVWRFRPYPSRLAAVRHMIAVGWGQDVLFRDGHYRTDFIRPETDCVELMSWWDWSPLGPWSTPFERLSEVLSKASIEAWKPYFVTDPVTGLAMWNNQPGDYDGYNERFGGLPAFREAIGTYRGMGPLVTLYTDPFRMDDASKIGQAHGREWCVIGVDGKPSTGYDVWNPCHDIPAVRRWVADTMGRLIRETGADGIRLDEYGHVGWACYSTEHEHTFAEPGITQWQKAVAETTRMVREAMDAVDPGSVLTTEHPGYDYLMQYLDGCITYDLTVQSSPLRPLPCNLQRFYFPECKAFELDHRGADPGDRVKLWTGVASFGRYYPPAFYTILCQNADAYDSRDCEPLIRTPGQARGIYVNRFRAGAKTLFHLHNATGHTFEGTALAVDCSPGEHLVDLVSCEEVPLGPERSGSRPARLYVGRGETLCLALMRRELSVERDGTTVEVRVGHRGAGRMLVLSDAQGGALLSAPADGPPVRWDIAALPESDDPACVKLLRGGLLIDVAPIPAEHP